MLDPYHDFLVLKWLPEHETNIAEHDGYTHLISWALKSLYFQSLEKNDAYPRQTEDIFLKNSYCHANICHGKAAVEGLY